MELTEEFNQAAEDVQKLSQRPNNDDLLTLYSLYKQAANGEVSGKRPGALNIVGRRKYDEWASLKGMPKEEAMRKYIEKVNELKSSH